MAIYDNGDRVNCSAAFTNASDVATDPTAIVFTMREPDGTETAYTYGVDAELVKDSTGNYHVLWDVTQEGLHVYRFVGTGTVRASDDEQFTVEPRLF